MSLDDFARVPLLFGPSPIHPLRRLSAALGGGVEIWAKREDCNSGIAFGGNKVRKLEYLVAEALAQGCDTLVSIGGVQSNHTAQVTGVACHLGLKAVTVQEWVESSDPVYGRVGNIQLTRIMGGDIRWTPPASTSVSRQLAGRARVRARQPAASRTRSPPGASDHPLGGLGFANWAREVAAAGGRARCVLRPRVVCTVTGSTHAGMIAGFALEDRDDRRVIGIDASKRWTHTTTRWPDRQRHRRGHRRGSRPAGRRDHRRRRLRRPAYGIPDDPTIEAIHLAARTEGMLTDPVYEGKSMAGLIGMVRSGEIPPAPGCSTPTSAANRRCPPTPGHPAWGEDASDLRSR